jgi:hypothetical protein
VPRVRRAGARLAGDVRLEAGDVRLDAEPVDLAGAFFAGALFAGAAWAAVDLVGAADPSRE